MPVESAINGTSTAAQRRAIVLAGRARGLDVDAIRAMTPAGSIRALSFEQASRILDSLKGRGVTDGAFDESRGSGRDGVGRRPGGAENGTGPSGPPCENQTNAGSRRRRSGGCEGSRPRRRRYPRAAAGVWRLRTDEQLRFIESLREQLAWAPAGVDALCRRIAGVPLAKVASARDASRVIVAMRNILTWHRRKARRGAVAGSDPFERPAQRPGVGLPDVQEEPRERSGVGCV